MKKKSLILGAFAAVALLVGVTVNVTMAFLKAGTNELVNTFDVGSVETEILEGEDGYKNPMIKNLGENDCYVRARVLISPAKAADNVDLVGGSGWELKSDGYYYYNEALPNEDLPDTEEKENVTTAIFETIKIKDGVDWDSLRITDFEVTVYQEAVQTVVYVDGNAVTDVDVIWNIYEAESAQSSGQN